MNTKYVIQQFEADGMGGMKLNQDLPDESFADVYEAIAEATIRAHAIAEAIDGIITVNESSVFVESDDNRYELRIGTLQQATVEVSTVDDFIKKLTLKIAELEKRIAELELRAEEAESAKDQEFNFRLWKYE